jgi:hypothetical protein
MLPRQTNKTRIFRCWFNNLDVARLREIASPVRWRVGGLLRTSGLLRSSGLRSRLPLLHFRAVMADDTARGGAGDRMMTGNMSGYSADGGPFQATLCLNEAQREHGQADDHCRQMFVVR